MVSKINVELFVVIFVGVFVLVGLIVPMLPNLGTYLQPTVGEIYGLQQCCDKCSAADCSYCASVCETTLSGISPTLPPPPNNCNCSGWYYGTCGCNNCPSNMRCVKRDCDARIPNCNWVQFSCLPSDLCTQGGRGPTTGTATPTPTPTPTPPPIRTIYFTGSNFSCNPSGTDYACKFDYRTNFPENVLLIFTLKNSTGMLLPGGVSTSVLTSKTGTTSPAIFHCASVNKGLYNVSWYAFNASDALYITPLNASIFSGQPYVTINCS